MSDANDFLESLPEEPVNAIAPAMLPALTTKHDMFRAWADALPESVQTQMQMHYDRLWEHHERNIRRTRFGDNADLTVFQEVALHEAVKEQVECGGVTAFELQ